MACLKLPTLPVPQLPDGITLTPPPIPPIPGIPDLFCCKLPLPAIPIPPIPIPSLVLNSGIIAALNAQIALVIAYVNGLQVDCPLE